MFNCKLLILFLLFLFSFTGCQKEPMEPLTELPVDGKQKTIKIEENGIAIEFCLLDSSNQPATVFNKGENFKFHLSLTNNCKPDSVMYIVSEFLHNPCLFLVYTNSGDSIGKPIKGVACEEISDGINQIELGEEWIMEIPWTETRTYSFYYEPDEIRFLQCEYTGLNMQPLDTGIYYTELTQQFCLGRYLPHPQQNLKCTSMLDLRINFQVK